MSAEDIEYYPVQENQNIFDITISKFGILENLFDVLEDNELEISQNITPGTVLKIDNFRKGIESIKQLNLQTANGFGEAEIMDNTLVYSSGNQIIYKTEGYYLTHI